MPNNIKPKKNSKTITKDTINTINTAESCTNGCIHEGPCTYDEEGNMAYCESNFSKNSVDTTKNECCSNNIVNSIIYMPYSLANKLILQTPSFGVQCGINIQADRECVGNVCGCVKGIPFTKAGRTIIPCKIHPQGSSGREANCLCDGGGRSGLTEERVREIILTTLL